jgi:hypothetical protein
VKVLAHILVFLLLAPAMPVMAEADCGAMQASAMHEHAEPEQHDCCDTPEAPSEMSCSSGAHCLQCPPATPALSGEELITSLHVRLGGSVTFDLSIWPGDNLPPPLRPPIA